MATIQKGAPDQPFIAHSYIFYLEVMFSIGIVTSMFFLLHEIFRKWNQTRKEDERRLIETHKVIREMMLTMMRQDEQKKIKSMTGPSPRRPSIVESVNRVKPIVFQSQNRLHDKEVGRSVPLKATSIAQTAYQRLGIHESRTGNQTIFRIPEESNL